MKVSVHRRVTHNMGMKRDGRPRASIVGQSTLGSNKQEGQVLASSLNLGARMSGSIQSGQCIQIMQKHLSDVKIRSQGFACKVVEDFEGHFEAILELFRTIT